MAEVKKDEKEYVLVLVRAGHLHAQVHNYPTFGCTSRCTLYIVILVELDDLVSQAGLKIVDFSEAKSRIRLSPERLISEDDREGSTLH